MTAGNIDRELAYADFPSQGEGYFRTPEGIVFDFGTTVPSSAVGYAPGGFFVQTDGTSEATYWYVNTGTKASSNFVAIDLNVAEMALLSGLAATAAEINAKCDNSANYEVVTTTNAITAAETGKKFILNTATAFVSTLPAPALGLEFWFYIGATAPTTSHTVVTASSANILYGNISSPEDAAGSVTVTAASDTITFVALKALTGDYAHVWSDGTNYYVDGMCSVQDAMTLTQAS
jgi:hypothetical protein